MTRGLKIVWTEEVKHHCISSYSNGKSTRDLAKELGVSYQSVATMLRGEGVDLCAGKKISLKMTGRPSPRKGAVVSEETRERMREARKKVPPHYGYKFTAEQRARMSAARKRYFATTPKELRTPVAAKKKLSDLERAAINRVRNAAKRMIQRVLKMSRKRKDKKTEQLLGYTKAELRAHIEKQFKDGMSWEARNSFHIDHIYPVAAHFRDGITDPSIINALSNLQVLTPFENQSKSDRFDPQMRGQVLTIDSNGTRQGL